MLRVLLKTYRLRHHVGSSKAADVSNLLFLGGGGGVRMVANCCFKIWGQTNRLTNYLIKLWLFHLLKGMTILSL